MTTKESTFHKIFYVRPFGNRTYWRWNAKFEESLEMNIFTYCIGMGIVIIITSPCMIYKTIKQKINSKKNRTVRPMPTYFHNRGDLLSSRTSQVI